MADVPGTATDQARPHAWGKLALVAVLLVVLVLVGRSAGRYVGEFAATVESIGVWAPIVFIGGYVVATVAFVPGSVLTLAAGALFGLLWGTVYVWIAATLGACAAFLVSRYLARGLVARRLEGNARFAAIDRAIGRKGRRIVFLLRLSPLFPFNLLNYALGLTDVRFVDYLVACAGMLPGTLRYVYYGKVAGDVAGAAGGGAERGAAEHLLLGVGLIATIAVATIVARTARRALAEEIDLE